jgi:hypothetical protein
MFTDRVVGELQQIKVDIQKWLTGRSETPEVDAALTRRNAEELIWKLQERYGYIPDKHELDQ